MAHRVGILIFCCCLLTIVVGCGRNRTAQPTYTPTVEVAGATDVPTSTSPPPTFTAVAMASEPSATATQLPTETPEPSATATTQLPTETPEPTDTLEPTETATSVPVPSTATVRTTSTPPPTPLPTQIVLVGVQKIDVEGIGESAELAPNGNLIAWLSPAFGPRPAELCLAEVDALDEQTCHELDGFLGLPYRLSWSPDSRWIAFSEDPVSQAVESDIWLLDVTTGSLVNRTDDNIDGPVDGLYAGNFALDYLPMWHPTTGELYFWRSTWRGANRTGLDLMRLDPATEDDPLRLLALDDQLGVERIPYSVQRFYLDGPSAISPDGRQLAVLTTPAQEMDLSPNHGLWLIDLDDARAAPELIVSSLAWQAAFPSWWSQPAVAQGLSWTADGDGVVVAALSSDLRLPLLLPYYVDVNEASLPNLGVVPFISYRDIPDRAAFFQLSPDDAHPLRFEVPWTVALVPESNVLLLINELGGITYIRSAVIPPQGDGVNQLTALLNHEYAVLTRSSGGAGGHVLVYGLLLTTEVE